MFEMVERERGSFGWHRRWVAVLDGRPGTFKIPNWNLKDHRETECGRNARVSGRSS